MELTDKTPRNIAGAALLATLWHPYLGVALARALGLIFPSSAQTAVVIAGGLVSAWIAIFVGEMLNDSIGRQRWLHVDTVLADPSLSIGEKLRGIASSWVGRALLLGFAGYLVVLGTGLARLVAG